VNIIEPVDGTGGGDRTRRNRGAEGIQSPNIYEVHEEDWHTHPLGPFHSKTAVRIAADSSHASDREAWDFYVNVDNENIRLHSTRKNEPLESVRKSFSTAIVFSALAIIRGESADDPGNSDGDQRRAESRAEDLPATVDRITAHLSPVLLPVIAALGIDDGTGASD
jgi:hypothetical protein